MKVLHVIPAVSPKYGGPSNALLPMCRALQAQGIEVQIASTDAEPGGRLAVELNSLVSYEGIPAIFFRKQFSEAFKYSSALARWLDQNVADFDLVHIHSVFSHACLSASRACQRQRVPYVVRPVGHLERWGLDQKPLRKKMFLRFGGSQMLRDAAAIHYVSENEKRSSEESLGVNHGVTIPLGIKVDSTSLSEAAEQNPGRQPYVLVLSRLLPTKGIDVLVKAFLAALSDPNLSEWQLLIAGDGPQQFEALLKELIRQADAGDSVVLTGWLDGKAKAEALQGASMLALPSHHEAFGVCVAEAMARGIPVLISPEVGLAPEVRSAGAGWIVPIDTESIRHALQTALNDRSEMIRRGEAGRKLARRFDWNIVGQELAEFYRSISQSIQHQQ